MGGQGNGKEVKLLGTWFSPYAQRVAWMLKLKGIDYEWVEQGFRDPKNRSQLLLKYNPVMKTVPVLVHHGRPVLESLIILEYIDETWKNNPILPSDPYERAMVRFWANLIDQKVQITTLCSLSHKFGNRITKILSKLLSLTDKKQMEEEMKQVSNTIEILDRELKAKGNKFFGGIITYWTEEGLGINIFDSQNYPFIAQWKTNLLEFIQQCLPPKQRLLRFYRKYRQSKL
ncbi:putative glutathione S-transferase [Gossypium australe]|uniref:Glutathione S-transferase n=1 Tax=Gossypium australe TaxID=47621 RepID=A0A5B6VSG8_9ROSI|nr:putative glutathione S-transferase [Gossypium australe]